MPRTFKISFVDRNGNLIPDPSRQDTSNAIPVLEVIVCPPGVMSGQGIRCWALVDTGADHAVVGRSLIERSGATLLRSVSNSGVTGQADTTLHDLTFFLTASDGHQLAIHSDAAATDHTHTAYPVILGRSLLRHGSLVLDYGAEIFEFRVPSHGNVG
ncbi:hypothetical protein JH261_02190 [Xanthomonas campestris pv. incanae]|nr:hypothetical protein JH261_02190 [Xanthomonas campestris pv. incanae]